MSATVQTPEQMAMGAATTAVRHILAAAKNPRTVLGRARPNTVAWHAAWQAITVHREVLAHEQARRSGGICAACGLTANDGKEGS